MSIMTSYTGWCEAHGYEPKNTKGVAQALAAYGFDIGIRQWVSTDPRGRVKVRGVRGLNILNFA